MTSPELSTDQGTDWIVCYGETRDVSAGLVACPRRASRPLSSDECDGCHLLSWRADDRHRGTQCALSSTAE
jgi:hypothetical protein